MSNNKYKILLVEDEANIRLLVETLLTSAGYQVIPALTCAAALTMYASHLPDLVILDLGLPDADGMNFLKKLRAGALTPVIILSARSDERDKVAALDLGANDYMVKPFGNAELLARIRAALRSGRREELLGGKYACGDLEIDYDRRQVSVAGEIVHLTQTEFNILSLLSQHSGKVLTYSAIIRTIWGGMDDGSVKKLQVNMANIRKKLGCCPGDNRYVINELGVGYRIADE